MVCQIDRVKGQSPNSIGRAAPFPCRNQHRRRQYALSVAWVRTAVSVTGEIQGHGRINMMSALIPILYLHTDLIEAFYSTFWLVRRSQSDILTTEVYGKPGIFV